MAIWHNADGLPVRFGSDQGKRQGVLGMNRAGVTNHLGAYQELEFEVDLTGAARTTYTADLNNDGTMDGFEKGLDTPLPANCKVISVDYIQHVAPAGGTSWQVGTYQLNGTVDNATGILTAAQAAGAQVGTSLTADRYLAVTTVGTYTAGKVTVVVRYIPKPADL